MKIDLKKVFKSGLFPGDWILAKAICFTVLAIGCAIAAYSTANVAIENYNLFYEIVTNGTTAMINEIHNTTTPGIPVEIVTEILTLIEQTNMSSEEQFHCLINLRNNLINYQQANSNLEILEAQRLQQLINLFDGLAEDQHTTTKNIQNFITQSLKTSSKGKGFIE
jgi:hypothetical protein